MEITTVKRVIDAAGGPSALAKALDIKQPSVSGWVRVPAERVLEVERITGIDRKEIRPDIFGEAS
tara:strand:- start:360 stop:554 length:195 start_codon:yes stop_codon:yes gene_type:complete